MASPSIAHAPSQQTNGAQPQGRHSQPFFSPITPSSPTSPSTAASIVSLSPFDVVEFSEKTPAHAKHGGAASSAPHTRSPPSSVPNTVIHRQNIMLRQSKRTRRPSAKAQDVVALAATSSESTAAIRRRDFAYEAQGKEDEQDGPEDSPCLPRRKRTASTLQAGQSTSPPFWVEILLPPRSRQAVAPVQKEAQIIPGQMAAPLSTVPLRRQNEEHQQRQLARAQTPPNQLARNRSPPPPPASVLRMANFDSSSRERRQERQRQMLVRTASGYEPTPTGPARSVDLKPESSSTSSDAGSLFDGVERRPPSPIKFVSPAELGAILYNPSSSSSRTSIKDTASYLSQMNNDAQAGTGKAASRGRHRVLDALKASSSEGISTSQQKEGTSKVQAEAAGQENAQVAKQKISEPVPPRRSGPSWLAEVSSPSWVLSKDQDGLKHVARSPQLLPRWRRPDETLESRAVFAVDLTNHVGEAHAGKDVREGTGKTARKRNLSQTSADLVTCRDESPWRDEAPLRQPVQKRPKTRASDHVHGRELKLPASRELPSSSYYAQNKREETSPSPPSRHIVSDQLDLDALRSGRRQDEDEDGSESDEDVSYNDEDEEAAAESELEQDDGDLQARRRRSRVFYSKMEKQSRAKRTLPTLKRSAARAAAPQTPPKQSRPGSYGYDF